MEEVFMPQEGLVQQQQSQYGYVDGYQPSQDETKFNFMRWQLDTDGFLESVEFWLRGYKKITKDGESNWVERKGTPATLNELGISRIMTIIGSRITKEDMMSDLDEEKIAMIAKDCADDVNDLLYEEGDSFGLRDSDWKVIVNLIQDQVYITLRRSYKGGERRFISLIERAVEQYITRNEENQRNPSLMNPATWFKKR